MEKFKVGIAGSTGMVGQRLIVLMHGHPWLKVTALAASPESADKCYADAVKGRWMMKSGMPRHIAHMKVQDASDIKNISKGLDLIFSAVDFKNIKNANRAVIDLEESYARFGIPVVSLNSANRLTPDVPMIIPEINPEHLKVIEFQMKRIGTKTGFIVTKPNCSIQIYVPPLSALRHFGLAEVMISTYQAVSGAGKTLKNWPEMSDNVIPYIGGEEEKSEKEPLKIWGELRGKKIINSSEPIISAQCARVPVSDGHLANVWVKFIDRPDKDQIIAAWKNFTGHPQLYKLPSAPLRFLKYFQEPDRPQTKLDRSLGKGGMGIAIGRLRPDNIFDYKFSCLSHNTIRGAAGGAILTAELLIKLGYIKKTS